MNAGRWTSLTGAFAVAVVLAATFVHLGYCGIYRWDESRNAINALEMSESGNPLVRTYNGQPDHWETKPPLLIWLQVIAIKALGPTETALRLPSALAGLGLAGLIFLFLYRQTGDRLAGIFAVLVLFTSGGYVRPHVLRSGDHDALLVLWLTAATLAFYRFLRGAPDKKPGKFLLFTALALTAAALTKSISALFLLPGMALFTLATGKLLPLLRNRWFYIGSGVFVAVVGAYYLARTHFDPDYLYWVSHNELFKRYLNTSTEYSYQTASPWFYLQLMKQGQFKIWIWFLPLILVCFRRKSDARSRHLAAYLAAVSAVFLVVISGGTKNDWYAAPAYPLLAMLLGLSLSQTASLALTRWLPQSREKQAAAVFLLTVALFAYPVCDIARSQVWKPRPQHSDMAYGNFLRDWERSPQADSPLVILSECGNAHVEFYARLYRDYQNRSAESMDLCEDNILAGVRRLPADKNYLVCRSEFLWAIDSLWLYDVYLTGEFCRIIRLDRPKAPAGP